jgi:uncharacterized protein
MTLLRVVPRDVMWLPWSEEAFARARAERKPVLLSITTAWSSCCREMDRTSYADPSIAFEINDRFIPVRVDADRRPDISERYSLGGWPTTAFLTADGELLGGGTFVSADRLPVVLGDVRRAFDQRAASIETAPRLQPDAAPSDRTPGRALEPRLVAERVFELFDAEFGGFGAEPKCPHTAPLHLALALHRDAPDPRLETIVTRTLDAIGWGPLHDDANGGFFRYAASRDWSGPHHEKTLDTNAALIRIYVEAAQALEAGRFVECANDAVQFVQSTFADPDKGGWYASQDPDATVSDRALYADANAAMASAALAAATAFDDDALRQFALTSLERVLLACYKPGHGVAHYFDEGPRVRGLLADQIAMASAQLDAFDVTGDIVYEMMAEELAHYALRAMWDEDSGGFFDRAAAAGADAVGLLRIRLKPFVVNCDAARMLRRLAASSGNSEFGLRADETLRAMASDARRQGVFAAHYALAAL